MKTLLKTASHLLFRTKVQGLNKFDFSKPSILIPNHVSLADAAVLFGELPEDVHYVVNTGIAERFKTLLKGRNFITVDPMNPYSVRDMIRVLREGKPLVIFPEGRITVTGGLMKVYHGVGYIAMRTGATLYPIAINGLERSRISYLKEKNPTVLFPPVHISIGDPFTIPKEDGVPMRKQKERASRTIYEALQNELFRSRHKPALNLYNEMVDASKIFGKKFPIAEDITSKVNYKELILGSIALANEFSPLLKEEKNIGLLLPTSVGHAISIFALFRLGKTPAVLNFSLGVQTFKDCCEATSIKTVLTSREFILKGKLDHLVDAMDEAGIQVVYLEDVKRGITKSAKLTALRTSLTNPYSKFDDGELILFTSGSESKPKGVVLSHANLYANMQQAKTMIDFTSRDKFFTFLPMFHTFGLSVGTLLPIVLGIPVYLYPSPLHYKVIPELIYEKRATIIFGTSTFLQNYAKTAHPYDFFSVRYSFAGGEKLKPEVRNAWNQKFGIRILEGYGVTETSPILAINSAVLNKEGTVGRLVPGIEWELRPVPGIEKGGELIVSGPNVMKGYLIHGKGFVPCDGSYATGDLAEMDEDGFLTITSRIKRFAKLGGEMVSLNLVEEIASRCFGHLGFAALSVPDSRKGERVILYTTDETATIERIRSFIGECGYSPLSCPAEIRTIASIPVLGTGKTDYVALKSLTV